MTKLKTSIKKTNLLFLLSLYVFSFILSFSLKNKHLSFNGKIIDNKILNNKNYTNFETKYTDIDILVISDLNKYNNQTLDNNYKICQNSTAKYVNTTNITTKIIKKSNSNLIKNTLSKNNTNKIITNIRNYEYLNLYPNKTFLKKELLISKNNSYKNLKDDLKKNSQNIDYTNNQYKYSLHNKNNQNINFLNIGNLFDFINNIKHKIFKSLLNISDYNNYFINKELNYLNRIVKLYIKLSIIKLFAIDSNHNYEYHNNTVNKLKKKIPLFKMSLEDFIKTNQFNIWINNFSKDNNISYKDAFKEVENIFYKAKDYYVYYEYQNSLGNKVININLDNFYNIDKKHLSIKNKSLR